MGTTVTLNTSGEFSLVAGGIADDGIGYWVGLRQAEGAPSTSVGWSWVDTTSTFRQWLNNEPNDSNFSEDDQENCAALLPAGMSDEDCIVGRGFICEKITAPSPALP